MSIDFRKNIYYDIVFSGDGKYATEKDLRDDVQKNPLKMSYGDANPSLYSMEYKKLGRGGGILAFRKIAAIPLAMIAIVEAIYHLAKALFFGYQSQMKRPNAVAKSMQQMILVRHDIAEIMGWLKVIYNDTLGQFEVERAQFEKTCTYLSQSKNQAPIQQSPTQRYIDQYMAQIASNASKHKKPGLSYSLEQFFNFEKMKRDCLIDGLTDNETLKKYVKEDPEFIEYMQSLNGLENFTCEELSKPLEDSKFKALALSDDEILDMKFQDAWELLHNGDLSGALIKFRLERISVPSRTLARFTMSLYSPKYDSESTLRDVRAISPQILFDQIKQGNLPSEEVISFMSFEQLSQLEIEKMDPVPLSIIISRFKSIYFLNKWLDSYEPKIKLKIINQLKQKEAPSFNEKTMLNKWYGKDFYMSHKLSEVYGFLPEIFSGLSTLEKKQKAEKDPSDFFQAILKAKCNDSTLLSLISKVHMGLIDFSFHSEEKLIQLFKTIPEDKAKQLFAHISIDKITDAVLYGQVADKFLFTLMSNEQLNAVDTCTKQYIGNSFGMIQELLKSSRFVPPSLLQSGKYGKEGLPLDSLPEKTLNLLDFTKVSKSNLKNLFYLCTFAVFQVNDENFLMWTSTDWKEEQLIRSLSEKSRAYVEKELRFCSDKIGLTDEEISEFARANQEALNIVGLKQSEEENVPEFSQKVENELERLRKSTEEADIKKVTQLKTLKLELLAPL